MLTCKPSSILMQVLTPLIWYTSNQIHSRFETQPRHTFEESASDKYRGRFLFAPALYIKQNLESIMTPAHASKIQELNDRFRKGDRSLGKTVVSESVSRLQPEQQLALTQLVRAFNNFTEGNDPHGEHDFGNVEFDGEKYFWKIDYYDTEFKYGAEDPSDESYTCRVLTIMHSSEY
jgi:hypothetical protein